MKFRDLSNITVNINPFVFLDIKSKKTQTKVRDIDGYYYTVTFACCDHYVNSVLNIVYKNKAV